MEKNYGYNRNNSYLSRYNAHRSKTNKGRNIDQKTITRVANQFIVSLSICLVVIILANFNGTFPEKVIGGVKWVVGTDYDFKKTVNSIKNTYVSGINDKIKSLQEGRDNLLGQTDAVDASSGSVSLMVMPVEGTITSPFGMRNDPITNKQGEHAGIDIAGDKGTPIMAAMDGIVTKIQETSTLGRSVTLVHSGGIETIYGHCSEILVDENQVVKQGDYIAKVGDTGVVTAPHLHFEVRRDGVPIDPMELMPGVMEHK